MPRLNLDEMKKELFEDIEVVIGGVVYRVEKITADMLKVDEAEAEDLGKCGERLTKLFGLRKNPFENEDVRVLTKAYQFVMESITEQFESSTKNLSGTEEKESA